MSISFSTKLEDAALEEDEEDENNDSKSYMDKYRGCAAATAP